MKTKLTASKKPSLNFELEHAFRTIKENDGYGSIEIMVQDSVVTQISVRNIKKTKMDIKNSLLTEFLT